MPNGIHLKLRVNNLLHKYLMKITNSILIVLICALVTSCSEKSKKKNVQPITIVQKVDDLSKIIESEIGSFEKVVTLDHHRMAAEAGVYTPPSIAMIFSDPEINTNLVQQNQLVGLDLPFKVLCYSESDTLSAKFAYTSPDFIEKRHQLDVNSLKNYSSRLNTVVEKLPEKMNSPTNVSTVDKGFGIVKIKSDFDFVTSVRNLRNIVMAQDDTQWFADVDYQNEALLLGTEIRPTTLLLFGGPAPGGKAMMSTPKIGLDAFCQKLLVYENEDGEVWIAYNDIVAFSELYYQSHTKPQQIINQRLKITFTSAVTIQNTK